MKPFYFYIALVLLINGSMPVFEKITLGKVSVPQMVFLRGIVQVALYAALLWSTGGLQSLSQVEPRFIFYGLLQGAAISAMLYAYFLAMQSGDASQVKALSSAAPLLTFALAVWLIGEPLTLQRGLGIALVVAGIFLLG